jgi:hypothetical protein
VSHFLYAMQIGVEAPPYSSYLKIGHSVDPEKRMVTHQIGSPFPLRYAAIWRFRTREIAIRVEGDCHRAFKQRHIRGEWYDVTLGDLLETVPAYLGSIHFWCTTDGTIPQAGRWPNLQEIAAANLAGVR